MSHYVKSRLDKIKTDLDETKFLISNSYRLFLQKIARGTTGRYDIGVIFGEGVFTDNKIISVNPLHPYLDELDTTEKTLIILGQIAHETFHIIYTDFRVLEDIKKRYEAKGGFRMGLVFRLNNIIEDSAIELIGTNYYTGSFRQAIIALNKNAFENMPSLNELTSEGAPRLTVFMQVCAMYSILGELKGSIEDEEILGIFEDAMPILDRGRIQKNSWGRLKCAEEVYTLMTPLIEEAEREHEMREALKSFEYTKNESMPKGSSSGTSEIPPEIKEDFTKESREKTKEKIKEEIEKEKTKRSDSAGKDENDEEGISSARGEKTSSACSEEGTEGSPDSKEKPGRDDEDSSGEDRDKGDDDSSDSEVKDCEDKSDEDGDRDEKKKVTKELKEALKELEEQLSEAFEDAAKEEYDKEEMRKRNEEIKEFAKEFKFSSLHSHIILKVERQFSVDERHVLRYNEEFDKIKGLARNLTKRLQDTIRYNEDVKTTGLISGKINKSQLYRMDKRVFYKRQDKSDEADLAILLLVDESGSMYGRRVRYARLASMMMYEVCEALKIPLAIVGFDAAHYGRQVRHRHYVDFNSRNKAEKYNLMKIEAREENRDGYSIKYAGEYLKRREEEDKILIVISDGLPAHPSGVDVYWGEWAIRDTGRVVRGFRNEGMQVFGLAIGDGKTGLKGIYTHNYIDIPQLQMLPVRLVNLIERNLLKE